MYTFLTWSGAKTTEESMKKDLVEKNAQISWQKSEPVLHYVDIIT